MTTVTAYVTRYSQRESQTPTRTDPILTDPGHSQEHVWSPSHHGVQLGDGVAASIGMMR